MRRAGGAAAVRLEDAFRRLATLEARVAVQRLEVGDWAGAFQAATRAEAEATEAQWLPMMRAAVRLQARAVQWERAEAMTEALGWGVIQ